jgi:hypothetical protein
MKLNNWITTCAATGLAGLSPGLLAQSTNDPAPAAGPVPVMTALSATTISGYVDTSAVWNPGTGNANAPPYLFNQNGAASKQDGFNLNMVDIKISKPQDATDWAAGYTLELNYGPDAAQILGGFAPIRQAFVALKTPVGNGINWQIGQWDNLLGYEVADSYKNPNFSRSYGYTIEPTEHVGLLGSYQFCDAVSLQLGVANELTAGVNRNTSGGTFGTGQYTIESKKALVSLLTLTAPTNWGSFGGSTLVLGVDYGPGNAYSHSGAAGIPANAHIVDKTHLYVGATINTPVKDLTFGAAWDSVNNYDQIAGVAGVQNGGVEGYASALDAYASYKVTDKITLNSRAEYVHGSGLDALFAETPYKGVAGTQTEQEAKVLDFTETVQYDLWANVISRLEVRWDTSADGSPHFGANTAAGNPSKNNALSVAANVIYKF